MNRAYQHCEMLARGSGSNFFFAFYSLPRAMFREMCVLYAYMRVTDDLGDDETLSLDQRRKNLTQWKESLKQATRDGMSEDLILQAMVDVARRKEIPESYLLEVIDGVESDLTPREFQTFEQLNGYCYQVAGVVGLCCLKIWGYREDVADVHQQAIDCGTAFQLTNILRDLAEDSQRDRVYLPTEDLERFQLTRADVIAATMTDSFRSLMQDQVAKAWGYYRNALPLLDCVSADGRVMLSGFLQAYSLLLKKIESRNYDVFSERIGLSRRRKLMIAGRSFLRIPAKITIPDLPHT